MASGEEDRWGYEIHASDNHGWERRRSGWSEGDPLVEEKATKQVTKQALKVILRQLVKAPGAVVTITSAIGDALGAPIGQFLKQKVMEIMSMAANINLLARDHFHKTSWIDVELTGDFEVRYRIEARQDVRELLELLAVVPATFASEEEPYFMGKAVVEACYLLQIEYLLDLPEGPSTQRFKLTIDIDV